MKADQLAGFLEKFAGAEIVLEGFPAQVQGIEVEFHIDSYTVSLTPVTNKTAILIDARRTG